SHFAAPALPILSDFLYILPIFVASLAGSSPCAHFAAMAGSRAYREAKAGGKPARPDRSKPEAALAQWKSTSLDMTGSTVQSSLAAPALRYNIQSLSSSQ